MITISPDLTFVATTDTTGLIRIWRTEAIDLVAQGCAGLTRNLSPEEWSQFLGEEPYAKTCPNLP